MNSSSAGEADRRAAGTDLITALLRPDGYPHPVASVRLIETHISWVLLTGSWAYKIKKPVNLGFLDFTTLESRRHFCEEELRLNRRFAPRIYESLVKICGTAQHPRIEGAGPVVDYAVKMREFPQEALASEMLARDALTVRHVDWLAQGVANFHGGAARADAASVFGTPDSVLKPALDNFQALDRCLSGHAVGEALRALREWTEREYALRETAFAARRKEGFIRECHGDLHLRNIAVLEGEPVPFDCIEFDERLRWIDVMSEIAFVVMDFEDRRR
ncbi:MAG TPA: aminoglycoside phosphotransferase, partial [Burkholderiales bacterium]|nr:aminoglycoside phosphotransferase [Burkholderiales bacterium]